LNNHEYQNVTATVHVTATVPKRYPTRMESCKPLYSKKRMGTCQPVTSVLRIRVDTSGE
jgi:hypothetical protein